jgi:uncharacterized protein (TIGR00156 family)
MEDNMNKKRFVFLACLFVSVGLAVYAQQGGYTGPGTTLMTVEEAKNLRDVSFVILQGKIERLLMKTQYLFSDDTGELILTIRDGLWGDVSVDENDVVEIRGIIIRNWGHQPRGNQAWRNQVLGTHVVAVESIKKL